MNRGLSANLGLGHSDFLERAAHPEVPCGSHSRAKVIQVVGIGAIENPRYSSLASQFDELAVELGLAKEASLMRVVCVARVSQFGGVNEDGTPKTADTARTFLRSLTDASLKTWATQALRDQQPFLLQTLDLNKNGMLDLEEVEAVVNLDDATSLTNLMVLAITLFQSKPPAIPQ